MAGGYHGLTLTELQTERASCIAAISRTRNARGYGVGTRNLQRESLRELREDLHEINKAIAALSGNDVTLVSFDDPADLDPRIF